METEKAVNDPVFATLLNLPGITIVRVDIDEQGDCLIKAESIEEEAARLFQITHREADVVST